MAANDDRPVHDWSMALAMHVVSRPLQILVVIGAVAGVLWVSPWIGLSGLLTLALLEGFPWSKDDAFELTAEDEPALHAMLKSLAERIGVTTPLEVRIVPDVGASIHRRRRRGRSVNVVDLGWPLVTTFSETELSGVLAHELAHERDLRGSHRHVHAARARLAETRRIPLIGSFLLRRTQADLHEREHRADAAAAAVVGASAVAGALHRTMQLEEAFETIVEHWTDVLAEEGEYPSDLFDVLPVTLADPVVLAWLDRGILHSMAFDRLEIEDPHPSYGTRMRRLGVDPAAAERAPGSPVAMSGALEVSRWAVLTGFDVGARDPRRPGLVAGSAAGRFDFDPSDAQGALRAATSEQLLRSALLRVGDTIETGDWRKLADDLDPDLIEVPSDIRDEAAKTILVNCVATSLITPLLHAGGSRANPWIQGLVRTNRGDEVNVFHVVETAIDTRDASQLRALIDMADVGVGA